MQQINYGGYQPTEGELREQENELLNAIGNTALLLGGTAGTSFLADVSRRMIDDRSSGGGIGFSDAAKESVSDLKRALQVISTNTEFDRNRRMVEQGEASPSGQNYTRLRRFLEEPGASGTSVPGEGFSLANSDRRNKNSLTQAAVAMRDAFIPSAEDLLSGRREANEYGGKSAEGPRTDTAFSRMPLVDLVREALPEQLLGFSPEVKDFRRTESGLSTMRGNAAQTIGSVGGRIGSDFINNGLRSFWWLVNAPQAVSDLAAEGITAQANRHGLYGQDHMLYDDALRNGWVRMSPEGEAIPDQGIREIYQRNIDNGPRLNATFDRLVQKSTLPNRDIGEIRDLKYEERQPYRLFSKRRTNNNLSSLLALPAAIGINAGIGLVNPLGGSDGRAAAVPSAEDPTQTANVLQEIASKYILGRQGDVLPWDEFKKVRPDVSKDEYMRYKAYKWDKKADYNPLDGDLNLFGGILKAELDDETAIFGPEVQFLGKSLPFTTALLPTAAGVLGAAAGAAAGRYGAFNLDGIPERQDDIRAERQAVINREAKLKQEGKFDNKAQKRTKQQLDRLQNKEQKVLAREKFLNSPTVAPISRRMRGMNPVMTGLAGGFAALGGASLFGAELERRRREKKAQENAENGLNNPQLPS